MTLAVFSLEWTARIEGAELKQFYNQLHYDLPGKYGTTVGRSVLELKKYELPHNRLACHWSAHQRGENKVFAVALEATHYTSNALTIVIYRRVPWNAHRPAVITHGIITTNPWTQTEEEATFHGRKLIEWLCDWLESKFGVRPKSKFPDDWLAKFESDLLQSTAPYTQERQREIHEQEDRKKREAKAITPADIELAPVKQEIPTMLSRHHIAHLENTSIERFVARFEEYPSAAYYPQSATGRHKPYFRERTRQEKLERTGAVTYLYYDIDSGALVAKIEAKHFTNDRLNIFFTWHDEAEQFAREFISDLGVFWKAPFPEWMKTEEYKQRQAEEAADKNKRQEQQLNTDDAVNSSQAHDTIHAASPSAVESLPNTIAKAEQFIKTSALEDLINHLEQGLSRNEARAKMSLSENGLKARQQRLRKFWNMSPGATWADLLEESTKRRGARNP